MEDSSQELVLYDSSDPASLNEFASIISGIKPAQEIVQDPEEIQRQIVVQLLHASSDEELEAFGSAVGWQTLEEVPIRIDGFRWRPSDFEAGAPVYVLVNGERLDTGDSVVLTTGSYNIMAQLANLAARKRFPAVRYLKVAERTTKGGFHPLWLVTPDAEKLRMAEANRSLTEAYRDESNPLDEPEEVKTKK
jgi:hypothetical protein